jgi:hypothetical protein
VFSRQFFFFPERYNFLKQRKWIQVMREECWHRPTANRLEQQQHSSPPGRDANYISTQ